MSFLFQRVDFDVIFAFVELVVLEQEMGYSWVC